MKTRAEREQELHALMVTQEGALAIIDLYHQTVVASAQPGSFRRIGLLAVQMIPRILDAEFPKPHA